MGDAKTKIPFVTSQQCENISGSYCTCYHWNDKFYHMEAVYIWLIRKLDMLRPLTYVCGKTEYQTKQMPV